MEKEYAEYLLKKIKEDYNLIAEDFSNTRGHFPERLKELDKYVKSGDKILDLGCGNGRLIELFDDKKVEYIGADISEKLIDIAKNKYPQGKFILTPALNLPFSDNYFDKIYCLAVFFHIPSEEFRTHFLKEVKKVLKPDGLLILTVWNLWHLWLHPLLWLKHKRLRKYFFLIIKYTFLKIIRKSKIDFKDVFIPWGDIAFRYIHCFTRSELKKIVRKIGFRIKEMGISEVPKTKESSIYLIAEK